tara:strand:- start:361 stop:603 length:243 start_codon:yes stop_codon:yes gene_type:complete
MGLQDLTVKESVSPYGKAVVATGSAQKESRAVYIKAAAGSGLEHIFTINGSDVTFNGLLVGHVYPFKITKANSTNVILLY